MITDHRSPNHGTRKAENGVAPVIDTLVIHYTGMMPTTRARDWLCNPESKVSAHYLIDEDGTIWQLVDEERRAGHAGVGAWRGWRDINSRSIGIELSNPGHDYGYRPFPEPLIEALTGLCHGILSRHPIPARNVVAHSDIAPARKIDPGELFPWRALADEGIGLWPEPGSPVAPGDAGVALTHIGYDLEANDMATVVGAFQRRYRPADFGGEADEETRAVIAGLADLVAATDTSA